MCVCACANFQLSQSWCGLMFTCSFTVVAGVYCKRNKQVTRITLMFSFKCNILHGNFGSLFNFVNGTWHTRSVVSGARMLSVDLLSPAWCQTGPPWTALAPTYSMDPPETYQINYWSYFNLGLLWMSALLTIQERWRKLRDTDDLCWSSFIQTRSRGNNL